MAQDRLASLAGTIAHSWIDEAGGLFLVPGGPLFVGGLALSLILAACLAVPRGHGRSPRLAVLARALFPRRLVASASGRADIAWFAFGILVFGLAFGWAFGSAERIAVAVTGLLGHPARAPLPQGATTVVSTVALFLAYEFAYWFDHWLSHKWAFLWQFHRVHHGAESLSLLTNFRVHPVDTIVFANITAACTGLTAGLLGALLGTAAHPYAIGATNVLIVLCGIGITHLQHSHLWVGFGPQLGRVLLGPAHHQIHHSADPVHFDRNFGSSLALFDRMFGTFHMPAPTRERLTFGLGDQQAAPHGLRAAVVDPFAGAARYAAGLIPRRASPHAPAPGAPTYRRRARRA